MISKKAQSEIITTVLIILLVLAAIVIVWQVVSGTMGKTKGQIDVTKQCIGITMSVTKAINGSEDGTIPGKVYVFRDSGNSEVEKVKAVIYVSGDGGATWQMNATGTKDLNVLNSDIINIAGLAVGNRVKVTPKLDDGTLCEALSEAKIVQAS